MYLKGKNILVISPESWGTSKLSKHHYALNLVSLGNRVWFLQPPKAFQYEKEKDFPEGLTLLADVFSFPGARFYPSFIRKRIFKKKISEMERASGTRFDVIWNFDNSRFFDLDCFDNAFKIHHRMDYHYNFQNKRACKSADLCLGVTQGIVSNMKPFNANSFFIHHGYAQPKISDAILPSSKEKIRALYIGNLLIPFINWHWINALVHAQPDVHFFLAGSYGKSNLINSFDSSSLDAVKKLMEKENVTFLGEKPPSDIYAYMNQTDILFAAYKANEFPEILANSHKIMGYLGSGKPIVCHEIGEYMRNSDLLYMASTEEEYLAQFEYVKTHLIETSDKLRADKRIAFALENTYVKQLAIIDQLITSIQK